MNPTLTMIKRIEFVSVSEVDVIFEANGVQFRRRAHVNCMMTTFTLKVDAFWIPSERPLEIVNAPGEAKP